jgi:Holliday junction DNA helicase RuvA
VQSAFEVGFRFKIAPGLGQSGSQVRLYIRVFWQQLRGETEFDEGQPTAALASATGSETRPQTKYPKTNIYGRRPHSRYNGGSMIAHLRGKLLAKHPNQAIVETAGVGYDLTISVPTFSELPAAGAEVALHIHTHVREDQIALYGFLRPSEKLLFEKLMTVSGIGPKLAITILSGMAADEMAGAIRGNDVARLTRIPGVGKKTAERMVLELRDKLPQPGPSSAPALPTMSATEEDVLSALVNLGYQRAAAEKALSVATKNGKGGSFDAMFRDAMAALSK